MTNVFIKFEKAGPNQILVTDLTSFAHWLSMSKVTVTLTFNIFKPEINREHLLYMTNICMRFEKARPTITLVTDWTMFTY